jgi:hypothetical protein
MLSAADKFIVEQAPWKLAKRASARKQLDDALYASAETAAHRGRAAASDPARIDREDLGAAGHDAPLEKLELANSPGASSPPARIHRHDRAGLPAHRRQERHRPHARPRRSGNQRARQSCSGVRTRREPRPEGESCPHRQRSRSTISPKSICASARSFPPSPSKARTSCCT